MLVDLEKVAAIIAEIAAEEITPRFGALSDNEIETKTGPNDFVTAADRGAEEKLQKAFAGLYPGAAFVGEESANSNPELLKNIVGQDAVWIVDPLDGTRNFVQGRPEYGTIVALVEKGEIRQGWIYAIPDGKFAMGSAGDGASWDGEKIHPHKKSEGLLTGYRAVGNIAEPWKSSMVPKLRSRFYTDPARCSAYAYLNLVRGLRDFALYSRCHPWDHAAGIVMLHEICGRAEYLDNGGAYAPIPTQGRPLLVAGNQESWRAVKDGVTS
ncbi:MAG: inositol phosphatase [Hyphococcus sp.]|nr:MAG: inositol phosphatase [Marinicaulis sp.]